MKRIKAELFCNSDKVCDISGIFVPVSKNGKVDNNTYKFFYRGYNRNVIKGNVIRYNNEDYYIVNVSDLGRIKIVKLNRTIETKSVKNVVSVLNY